MGGLVGGLVGGVVGGLVGECVGGCVGGGGLNVRVGGGAVEACVAVTVAEGVADPDDLPELHPVTAMAATIMATPTPGISFARCIGFPLQAMHTFCQHSVTASRQDRVTSG